MSSPPVFRYCLLEKFMGAFFVWLVWALKPGEPRIVAICTTEAEADRRIAGGGHGGALLHKERVPLDHDFGQRDIQSAIYKAARSRASEV